MAKNRELPQHLVDELRNGIDDIKNGAEFRQKRIQKISAKLKLPGLATLLSDKSEKLIDALSELPELRDDKSDNLH